MAEKGLTYTDYGKEKIKKSILNVEWIKWNEAKWSEVNFEG